jgi:hypothetical protein
MLCPYKKAKTLYTYNPLPTTEVKGIVPISSEEESFGKCNGHLCPLYNVREFNDYEHGGKIKEEQCARAVKEGGEEWRKVNEDTV